jgi:hypothetical protein
MSQVARVNLPVDQLDTTRRAVLKQLRLDLKAAAHEIESLYEKLDMADGTTSEDTRDTLGRALDSAAAMDRLGWPGA